MTIPKSYWLSFEDSDGSIETITIKAKTKAEALNAARAKHPDAYFAISSVNRRNEERAVCRKLRTDIRTLSSWRASNTGAFRFQHKGKKRRGMRHYPTPKGGWRRMRAPVTFTWKETTGSKINEFLSQWVDFLIEP